MFSIVQYIVFDVPIAPLPITLLDVLGNKLEFEIGISTDLCEAYQYMSYKDYLYFIKNYKKDIFVVLKLCNLFNKIFVGDLQNKCEFVQYHIDLESPDYTKKMCSNVIDYSKFGCTLDLQQQLSDSIICSYGIPVLYFKATGRDVDFTFKEYKLHNVTGYKELKIMPEDGSMPSSNFELNDLDFDWEAGWQVEISKTEFQSQFPDQVPTHKDFLWIPLMNRLWMINSAYGEAQEGLLWSAPTWKLTLNKYQDSSSVQKLDFSESIDTLIPNLYDKVFDNVETVEQETEAAYAQVQNPKHTATHLYTTEEKDLLRHILNNSQIKIEDIQIYHSNMPVCKNLYTFKSNFSNSTPKLAEFCRQPAIQYIPKYCGTCGSLSFLVQTPNTKPKTVFMNTIFPLVSMGKLCVYYFFDRRLNEWKIGLETLKFVQQTSQNVVSSPESSVELDKLRTQTVSLPKIDMGSGVYAVNVTWSLENFEANLSTTPHVCRLQTVEKDKVFGLLETNQRQFVFDTHNTNTLNCAYKPEFNAKTPQEVYLYPLPFKIGNLRLYTQFLTNAQLFKQNCQYTITDHPNLVINDLCRPLTDGSGFDVK